MEKWLYYNRGVGQIKLESVRYKLEFWIAFSSNEKSPVEFKQKVRPAKQIIRKLKKIKKYLEKLNIKPPKKIHWLK